MAETRGKIDWMKNSNFIIIFPYRLPNLAPKAFAKNINQKKAFLNHSALSLDVAFNPVVNILSLFLTNSSLNSFDFLLEELCKALHKLQSLDV